MVSLNFVAMAIALKQIPQRWTAEDRTSTVGVTVIAGRVALAIFD